MRCAATERGALARCGTHCLSGPSQRNASVRARCSPIWRSGTVSALACAKLRHVHATFISIHRSTADETVPNHSGPTLALSALPGARADPAAPAGARRARLHADRQRRPVLRLPLPRHFADQQEAGHPGRLRLRHRRTASTWATGTPTSTAVMYNGAQHRDGLLRRLQGEARRASASTSACCTTTTRVGRQQHATRSTTSRSTAAAPGPLTAKYSLRASPTSSASPDFERRYYLDARRQHRLRQRLGVDAARRLPGQLKNGACVDRDRRQRVLQLSPTTSSAAPTTSTGLVARPGLVSAPTDDFWPATPTRARTSATAPPCFGQQDLLTVHRQGDHDHENGDCHHQALQARRSA